MKTNKIEHIFRKVTEIPIKEAMEEPGLLDEMHWGQLFALREQIVVEKEENAQDYDEYIDICNYIELKYNLIYQNLNFSLSPQGIENYIWSFFSENKFDMNNINAKRDFKEYVSLAISLRSEILRKSEFKLKIFQNSGHISLFYSYVRKRYLEDNEERIFY